MRLHASAGPCGPPPTHSQLGLGGIAVGALTAAAWALSEAEAGNQ